MKFNVILATGLAAGASAHTIFQKISVNGQDKGQLVGIRAPPDDYPIYSVSDGNFACNRNSRTSSTVINVPSGARIGTWWGHVFGGAQFAGDPDNPIASSHKGPIQIYLAKVNNAATSASTGLQWFKVAQEGFNTGTKKWAVDTMISGGGWWYFTLPSCLANGNYLVRAELLALHSASSNLGAQFYMGCAQINITGGGSSTGGGYVSFPGAYRQNDPGIQLSIYGNNGQPDMGGRSYPIPGPSVWTCSSSGGSTGGGTGGTGSVALWGQCGGTGYTGATSCSQGTCKVVNQWYYQCQT